jgi:subtilisin-like proprotein convertase family protein
MKTALLSLILWGGTVLSSLSQTATYWNTNYIEIVDDAPASLYPSPITISSVPWRVASVTVTLSNLSHTSQSDVNVLLVSPQGQAAYIIAGPNGTVDFTDVTLTLDDSAPTEIPSLCTSGSYKPTGYFPDADYLFPVFPAPAPTGPYSPDLSVFQGADPNGTWSLFVFDDEREDSGMIEGGWSLNFEKVYPLALHPMPDGRMEVSWPTEADGYVLIATDSLQGNNWSVVTNPPEVVSGRKTIKLQPSASLRFFKLIKPL